MVLEVGKVYTVQCIQILPSGGLFELCDGSKEYISASRFCDHRVHNPADNIALGASYTAVCIVSTTTKKLELSLAINDSRHFQSRTKQSIDAFYLESGDSKLISPSRSKLRKRTRKRTKQNVAISSTRKRQKR